MTATTNLALPLISSGQLQPDVTHNEGITAIEDAITEAQAVEVADGTNSVSASEVRAAQFLRLVAGSPAPSAAVTVELPAVKRLLAVRNEAGQVATLECVAGGSPPQSVALADGEVALVYCDGSEVYRVGAAAESLRFSVATYISGKPSSSETLLRVRADRPFSVAEDLAGLQFVAAVAATASTAFDVQHDGASIGSITVSAAGTVGAAVVTATHVAVGETFAIIAPASQDATLADLDISIPANWEI